jgi:hypothetical protein
MQTILPVYETPVSAAGKTIMIVGFIFLALLGMTQSDAYQQFKAHSNNNPAYAFVWAEPCDSGLRSSGYAMAMRGKIFLKQVNNDGTVGAVCID